MGKLAARTLTVLLGAPLLLWAGYLGGGWLLAVILILVALGSREYYALAALCGYRPLKGAGLLGALWLAVAPALGVGGMAWAPPFLAVLLPWLAVFPALSLADLAITLGGPFYLALFTYLARLKELGTIPLLFLLTVTWASDIGAYLGGKAMGRRLLASRLSPRKTWEGTICGFLSAGLVSLAWAFYSGLPGATLLAIGLATGLAGQVGDLAESSLKRLAGVKDSGKLLPGHGGILDRFDSLLFAAPAAYFLWVVFIIGR